MALPFLTFCRRLGLTPEPGQEAMLRVAFEGAEPADVGPVAQKIYGYDRGTPARARDVVVLVAGGRGGKTKWSAGRCLHLACVVDVSRLAPGEHGYVLIVAPKLDLAGQALDYIKGMVAQDAALAARCDITAGEVTIDRGHGRHVTIATVAAGRGGAGLRGRSLLGALLDETAFFRDETSGAVNDQALFSAIAPRVIEGGQVIIQSTPWARTGLLYDLHRENWGRPTAALVAHAPTALLRSDEKILSYVAREYARDPENAAIEFGAQFGAASAATWLDPEALERAVSAETPRKVAPGDAVAAGGDLGFSRNSSALVVARRSPGGRIDFPLVDEERPTQGQPLRPSVVCARFAQQLLDHGARELVADRHYQETAREALDQAGLYLAEPPPPAEAWAVVRQLLRDGLLQLPQHPLLLAQLKAVRGKLVSGGGVSITLAATPDGRHSDLAAALALACWGLVKRPQLMAALAPAPGSPGWAEEQLQQQERRLEARAAGQRRRGEQWWDEGEGTAWAA